MHVRECFARAPCPQLVGYRLSVSLLALALALALSLSLALALVLTQTRKTPKPHNCRHSSASRTGSCVRGCKGAARRVTSSQSHERWGAAHPCRAPRRRVSHQIRFVLYRVVVLITLGHVNRGRHTAHANRNAQPPHERFRHLDVPAGNGKANT